jgi:MFS family permease
MNFIRRLRQAPRLVRLLAVHMFFDGFVPIAALYPIMFSRVGGLNIQQIGTLFAIWSLAFLICEIPSGVLADYWSRKWIVFASGIARALGFAIWILWPGFTGYAIGFALWGMCIACWSGAATAYLHDELRYDGKVDKFAKYYGYLMSVNTAGKLTGLIFAAILTLQHTNLLIGLSLISSVLLSAVLLWLPEHPYKKQATYLKTLGAGFREVTHSKKLRYLCYVMFSIYMTIGVIEELLPRVYASFGMSDTAVAMIIAASVVVAIFLLARLEWVSRFSLTIQSLVLCFGLATLILGLQIGAITGSLLVLIFALVFELFRPVFMHHVTAAAQGDERATIGSIPGLFGGLLGAGAYWLIGSVSQRTSETHAITLYSLLFLGVFVLLAFLGKAYQTPEPENEVSTNVVTPPEIL